MRGGAVDRRKGVGWPWAVFGRPGVPSWLLSLVFHLVVFLVLGLTLRIAPRQGAMAERTADVGIVLKHDEGETEYFEGPSDVGKASPTAPAAATGSLAELLDSPAPVDPTAALPASMGIIGPSALADAGAGHAAGALEGPTGPPTSYGGKAKTRVFGIEGEGYKFAYVFDRSASMGGSGRSALAAAKAELLKSLASLDTTHQFQIIFYNETPTVFNPSGQPGRLAFATEQTKERAARFVGQIIADGTTRHEPALLAAIRLQPDVIFFLTDADEPRLSPRQLYEIQRRAAGITINTIEFGLGPKPGGENFLAVLARQNGGQYAYVDITKILPARSRGR